MVWSYPSTPHERRHAPAGYSDYQSYKPWLRDEFNFRCVYCQLRERWFRPFGSDLFGADHLCSQKEHPELICAYTNLVYACLFCNSCKRQLSLLDPCVVAYADHLHVDEQGQVCALTAEGARLVEVLRLNREPLVRYRRDWLDLVALAQAFPYSETAARVRDLLSYPDDLPDLATLRPPAGNARPEGISESYFARSQRGQLPDTY